MLERKGQRCCYFRLYDSSSRILRESPETPLELIKEFGPVLNKYKKLTAILHTCNCITIATDTMKYLEINLGRGEETFLKVYLRTEKRTR